MQTTASSMIFTMELEINPSEYVIHEGVITDLAIGRLKNGESREVITSLCFLASGRFDISAVVRCFGTSGVDNRTARAHTTAIVKEMKWMQLHTDLNHWNRIIKLFNPFYS